MEDIGEMLIIFDPKKPGQRICVLMAPHQASDFHHAHLLLAGHPLRAGGHLQLGPSSCLQTPSIPSASWLLASHYLHLIYDFTMPALGLKYKPVACKVRPVATTLPEAAWPK